MSLNDSKNYQLCYHENIENPIDLENIFSNATGKLYVQGGKFPPFVINSPPKLEWNLLTNIIKAGQVVFSKDKWKTNDPGQINSEETMRKINSEFQMSDTNIQISQNAEILVNLYHQYLLTQKKEVNSKELEEKIEESFSNFEITKNTQIQNSSSYSLNDFDSDSEDIGSELEDKIITMRNRLIKNPEIELDDNHSEEGYDWHGRCKVLNIQSLLMKLRIK